MSTTMIANEFYTVSEAAEILGLTGARVRQLIASGQLNAEKFRDMMWMIPAKSLEKFRKSERPTGVHLDRR